MGVESEREILKDNSSKRIKEMIKYGRAKTYKKINSLLEKNIQEGFILTNHALAIIDDLLDKNNKISLDEVENIFYKSFHGEKIIVKDKKIKKIQKLGEVLKDLYENGFNNANEIFLEILRYWKIDRKDRHRKFKILSIKELDDLNKEIGGSIAKQFLLFLTPTLNLRLISKLADSYGRAIKYADNLSDLDEDLRRGYINISKKDLKKYGLSIETKSPDSLIIKGDLKGYKKEELQRVDLMFKKADNIIESISNVHPKEVMMLSLFRDVAISWFKQARELSV